MTMRPRPGDELHIPRHEADPRRALYGQAREAKIQSIKADAMAVGMEIMRKRSDPFRMAAYRQVLIETVLQPAADRIAALEAGRPL